MGLACGVSDEGDKECGEEEEEGLHGDGGEFL